MNQNIPESPENKTYFWLCGDQQGINQIIQSTDRPKMLYEGGPYSSMSCRYNSLDDLRKGCQIHTEKCIECGGVIKLNWLGNLGEKLKERNLCFSCDHWVDIINDKENQRRCFINATAYWRKDFRENIRNEDKHVLGFSGSVFKIKMLSGEQYITNDLWCNGTIPDRFRDRLPDNAVFESIK